MASSSNSGMPSTSGSVGLTVATVGGVIPGGGNPTVLSGAQATQLLQKLRSMNSNQTIKIQTIQTNSQTGAKQLVAIPIQSSGGQKMSSSPLKMIKLPASIGGSTQLAQVVTTTAGGAGMPPGVKVVKLTPAASQNSQQMFQQRSTQVSTPSKPILTPANPGVVTSQAFPSTSGTYKTAALSNRVPSEIVLEHTGRGTKRSDIDFDSFSDAKRRKTEKGGKGLRHFSMKVCEKVQAKGTTTYNEVADELVNELTDPRCASPTDQQYDQKNIRRRVYDALNVLMAMNIISKEKKEIRWLGLPTNSIQEANNLELEKARRIERIKAKTQQLQDLILQQIAFKNLVERNKERERREGAPAPNSAIQLPFIIVNTGKKTVIDCSISNDKMEYLFNFDDTFELHDDMEVLKRMGLCLGLERGQVSDENLAKARAMLPRVLDPYVTDLAKNGLGACSTMPKVSSPKPMPEMSQDHHSDGDSDSDGDVN